jgi:hypothetical protein
MTDSTPFSGKKHYQENRGLKREIFLVSSVRGPWIMSYGRKGKTTNVKLFRGL